jgi:hypothetical protein
MANGEAINQEAQQKPAEVDFVNHPPHYTQGGIEHVDTVTAWGLDYLLGNCTKYICRAGKKQGADVLQDLKKAQWYLTKKIALLEGVNHPTAEHPGDRY